MIAIDTNVLVYVRREEAPNHARARRILAELGEGPAHIGHLRRTVLGGRASGNLAHDAHIAALLREHGVEEIWTADRDFARFAGLQVRDPLAT